MSETNEAPENFDEEEVQNDSEDWDRGGDGGFNNMQFLSYNIIGKKMNAYLFPDHIGCFATQHSHNSLYTVQIKFRLPAQSV